MTEPVSVVRIPGDGVGPELVAGASRVVEALGVPVRWVDAAAGMSAYQDCGSTAPQSTITALRDHRFGIKGPFFTPSGGAIRSGNHYLRRELDLYACLRPLPILPDRPPVLLVRENTEDLYAAVEWMPTADVAQAVKIASRAGCERIARFAFETARLRGYSRVTAVHKANNLKLTEGMFLDCAREVASQYPEIEFDDLLADTAASSLVLDPGRFGVILTSHTVGDILSSLGAALAGSLGLVGSLDRGEGVYVAEACHGSADELAGTGRVNPLGFLRGVTLLLPELGRAREGQVLTAVLDAWTAGQARTFDLGGRVSTDEVFDRICASVGERMSEL